MISTRDLEYKDRRVAEREDIYFRKKAKKKSLIREMAEAVEKTKKMRSEVDDSLEKFKDEEAGKWVK